MKLVLFGSGIFADLAFHYFQSDSPYEVVGFTVDGAYVKAPTYQNLPLVAFEELDQMFPPETHALFVAVGYTRLNTIRQAKAEAARQKGYTLASYISSQAFNQAEAIADNCFVFENAVLQPFVHVGAGSIIWPGTVVSHESNVGAYCYLSPNVTLCGASKIGDRTFVGAGAVVRDSTTICADAIIGMGTIVSRELSDSGVYTGNPAQLVRRDVENVVI